MSDTPKQPNVVFILTDQWRACATGYNGDPNVKTPNLDKIAARSIDMTNTTSVCPVCTPARAALQCGRYPLTTGMFLNDICLPLDNVCVADVFKENGYDTGYIGKWHIDGHGRTDYIPPERRRGYDYWKVLECTHDYLASQYYAGDDPKPRMWEEYDAYSQTKDAQQYIRDHSGGDKPFFLMLGFGGPHFPHHTAPPEYQALYQPDQLTLRPNVPPEQEPRTRAELQGYYGHCTAIDRCVGDLFRTLHNAGVAEDTIFVFTSDHGDMHGSHDKKSWRKRFPWDESACVPFLCHYPRIHQGGQRFTTPFDTLDIMPTLLGLAGLEAPDTGDGEDLSAVFKGRGEIEDRACLIMNAVATPSYDNIPAFRAVRTERHLYAKTHDGPWLLYDNDNDPYQMNNRVNKPEHTPLLRQMESILNAKLEQVGDDFPTGPEAIARWGHAKNDV